MDELYASSVPPRKFKKLAVELACDNIIEGSKEKISMTEHRSHIDAA